MRKKDLIDAKIAALGNLCGITAQYDDTLDQRHDTSQETYRALLTAMRVPWEEPEILDQEIERRRLGPWAGLLEPVQLIPHRLAPGSVTLRLWTPTAAVPPAVEVHGEMVGESGQSWNWKSLLKPNPPAQSREVGRGFRTELEVALPTDLELGYYDLTLWVQSGGREETGKTRLIVAPKKVYLPECLQKGNKVWGFNLPLYALKSNGNWGIGDFADLIQLMDWAGRLGAAFVGVNPLHADSYHSRSSPSPYSPTSRMFLNFLYLNLEMAPELPASREAQELLASEEFQTLKARLAAAAEVQYEEIFPLKSRVLRLLYQAFVEQNGPPESPRTPRGEAFAGFLTARGEALAKYGHFCALADFFQEDDWGRWPSEYSHPAKPAAADFAREQLQSIRVYQYGQWLLASQHDQVCQEGSRRGLPLTLYQDLAIGASPDGSDIWGHQDLFALKATIGAPPDAFNPLGQNWGLPPLIPERLRQSGYQIFIDTLKANAPPGGMLRMDHVMGLFRLFWIPQGIETAKGTYITYPAKELLAILALESMRRRTVVIGEDLGNVPSWIRQGLVETGIFSYRVFYFEQDRNHHFLPPEAYPAQAIATVTTHDLATLAGYWEGRDLALRQELNLYPDASRAREDEEQRQQDRGALLEALRQRGLLPEDFHADPTSPRSCPRELREGVLEYLAQTPCYLLEVRLEEIFGIVEQQNLPGTQEERPNWRIKLPLTLEEMARDPEPDRLVAHLNKYRSPQISSLCWQGKTRKD